mgnify:CR=1 FL=1
MIKKIINYAKEKLSFLSHRRRISFLEAQVALLTLKILNLEKQQAINLQAINDLVKFENDVLKVIDYADEYSTTFDAQADSAFLAMFDDDDEFMN